MTEVLRALCRRVLPTDPPPTPASQIDALESPKIATYAQAAACTAADHAEMPSEAEPNTAKPLSSPSPSSPPSFDLWVPDVPAARPSPSTLFTAMQTSPVLAGLALDGVRWSQNGNLAVNFAPNKTHTQKDALTRVPAIWGAIRPLLNLPRRHPCPRVDSSERWHSVIVHDVPVPPVGDSLSSGDWLPRGGFVGTIEGTAVLCSDDALLSRKTVSYRLSLSSSAEAEFLVKHGALLFGSRCSVSHYVPRPRPRQSSP
ncbi:hypothetical protein B0H19DRAFT_1067387 [Mycena capillaripes]|nr:hypothetical protein B0H19DRAFT_1067387 [Mycena capillaripes]